MFNKRMHIMMTGGGIIALIIIIIGICRVWESFTAKANSMSGSIILSVKGSTQTYRAINPNNTAEYVDLSFNKLRAKNDLSFYSPVFTPEHLYILGVRDSYKCLSGIELFDISDGKISMIPIQWEKKEKKYPIQLFYYKSGYFIIREGKHAWMVPESGGKAYGIADNIGTGRSPLPYQQNVPVLKYSDGILYTSEENNVCFTNESRQAAVLFDAKDKLIKGWYHMGENLLAYDWQAGGSYIYDLSGQKMFKFGSQPYDILGNTDGGILLMMMPKEESGTTPLDFDIFWKELLLFRFHHVYEICIYNERNHLFTPIYHVNPSYGTVTEKWQSIDFDKDYFERINRILQDDTVQ